MDKTVFSLGSLTNPPDEKQYWLLKTPFERLEAIEIMRQIIYGYDPLPTDFKGFLKLLKEHEVKKIARSRLKDLNNFENLP